MHIERYGSGPRSFVGLHGWSGDHRTFLPVVNSLPEDVSFFSVDLPGCGRSPMPRAWSVEAVADEIAQAIWSLPAPLTLVGNCSGGLLGLEVAQRLGSRIERMVLIDLFAVFPWYFRVFLTKPFGPIAYATTFQNPAGRWLTNLSLRSKRAHDTTLTGGFAEVDHATTYKYLQLFGKFPAPESFANLTQRIELLYGDKTFQAVRESVNLWQSIWPRASATCLAGAGHLPIREASAQLRDILYCGDRRQIQAGVEIDGGICQVVTSAIAN